MIRSNRSHHIIQWDNVETRFNISSHILCYELDIQSKVGTPNACTEPQTTFSPLSHLQSRPH